MLSTIIFFMLFANLVVSSPEIPTYPKTCPAINPIPAVNYHLFPGFWYEVVSSTNVKFSCAIFEPAMVSEAEFRVPAKSKLDNGTVNRLDIHFHVGKPGNNESAPLVLDLYKGYLYHMILYPLYLDETLFITFTCTGPDDDTLEEIHVYSKNLNYDKDLVQKTIAASNLGAIPKFEGFSKCAKEFYTF